MADHYLTDEFIAFSAKIANLHERKKAATAEFTPIYEEFKLQMVAYNDEYEKFVNDWENWKSLNEPKKSASKAKEE